jgi:hypothetical protein
MVLDRAQARKRQSGKPFAQEDMAESQWSAIGESSVINDSVQHSLTRARALPLLY